MQKQRRRSQEITAQRTSQAAQGLKLQPPIHEEWVGSLVRELGPTCLATKHQNIKYKQYCNKFKKNFKNGPRQKKKNLKKKFYEKQNKQKLNSLATKRSPSPSSREIRNHLTQPLSSAGTQAPTRESDRVMTRTLVAAINSSLDSADFCPNSMLSSPLLKPFHEDACNLQCKTSPILLFGEELLRERCPMFSLLPESNTSFLLPLSGLVVSFGSTPT